jgi:hypothetical protein
VCRDIAFPPPGTVDAGFGLVLSHMSTVDAGARDALL